jgi:hypothetical protein
MRKKKAIEEANRISALKQLIGQVNKPTGFGVSKTGGAASVFWQIREFTPETRAMAAKFGRDLGGKPRAVSEGGSFHQREVAYQLLRSIAEMDKSELMPEIIPIVMPAEMRLGADGRIQIVSPILNTLDHVEVDRLHVCPGCDCIFYDRPNKRTCSVDCGNRKRQSKWRNDPKNAAKIASYRDRANEKRVGKAWPVHAPSPIFQAKIRSKTK